MWKPLVIVALGAMACGGSTEPTRDPAGTYALVSIGGQRLPFQTTGGDSARVIDAEIILLPDGRFTASETDSIWVSTVVPHYWNRFVRSDSGTWALATQILNFYGAPIQGVPTQIVTAYFSGDELDFGSGSAKWVYRRQ